MQRILSITLLVALAACQRPAQAPSDVVTLAVVGELQGVTEPCGCTTRPLGGLDRVAQAVETLAAAGPFGFLIAGNTFVTYPQPKAQEAAQETTKARTVAEVLLRLKPIAAGLGSWDENAVAKEALGALAQPSRAALGWPPRFTTQLRDVGGLKIGFVSTASDFTAHEAAAVNTQASDLRQAGAAVVLFLGAGGMPAARTLAPFLQGVDAVITGGGEPPMAPEQVGHAWLFDAGSKGQALGILQLHAKGGGAWQFSDGGAAARAALDVRRQRLVSEAASLPEGPGRDARATRAAALAEEIKAVHADAPGGAYFTWRTEDVDTAHPAAAWATEKLATYNRSLCATSRAATANRVCPTSDDGLSYVGNTLCKACHAGAFATYDKSQHARAWATLTRVGKDCDLSCIGCHTVGYEQPNGFCHLEDAPKFANVNCENCHGPASAHVAHPQDKTAWGARFVARPGVQTCLTCHTHEHSDQFNFETYVAKITGEGHERQKAP